jgi:hypothetical protein
MHSLDIAQFKDIKQLSQAFAASTEPLKTLSKARGVPAIKKQLVLLGPAAVAEWINRFAPELKEKPALTIAMTSPQDRGVEAVDQGRWYALLPEMLGRPHMDISVSLITTEADDEPREMDVPPEFGPAATRHALPLHAYLENRPDGPVDVIFFHDVDLLISSAHDWADELQRFAESGTRVAGVAAHPDEFELLSGLFELLGFGIKDVHADNRFASTGGVRTALPAWGRILWEVDCTGRTHGPLSENTETELRILFWFINAGAEFGDDYPPLSTFGRTVSGAESPASDGRALICLPDSIYFDPASERLFSKTENGLVSLKEMDDFGRKSALLASYDGRTTRIEQIMWAVRAFKDFVKHARDAERGEDEQAVAAAGDEDTEHCPHCGGIHSAEERVDAARHFLGSVLAGESPKTKLRAALQLALDIVENEGNRVTRSDEAEDPGAATLDDREIYESLLNRGYLLAALTMAQEADENLSFLDVGTDEEGRPILLLAMARCDYGLVEEILDAGASADATAEDGSTVFHIITESDNAPPGGLLRNLIARGANPNEADAVGNYPLEDAAVCGNLTAVASLIEIGADVAITDLNVEELAQELAQGGFEVAARLLTSREKKSGKRNKAKVPPN